MAMTIKPIFTLKEAVKSLWRNRLMSIASISSVSATLMILGIIFAIIININAMAQSAKDQFDSIQAYLVDDLTSEEITKIKEKIESVDGVMSVSYESKSDALKRMKESWKDNAYLLEGLESNPLPSSLIIYLRDIYYSGEVLSEIKDLDGIEEIKSYQDIVEQLLSITEAVRKTGIIVIFVLIAISTFIIHNTIKLTVTSRHREINIMKYVGATNWFIRWPFLAEGTLLGLIGAGISAGLMKISYDYVFNMMHSDFYVLVSAYVIPPESIMKDVIFLFLIIGAGIGALGSIWSMRKYLNV
ncbi:permease-like cell division protein FtsX [Fusibacter bizertensis]|uniref:Cell division protein FtsX n=1 Tax=Fusibacter bizertensis TaxID=1488331 RepID=A0ABT6NB92_9FIRM|nr:permease-like cell division protein FtsX [Fusibacter bizertensis]MDH8677688.1 permease-like cell division protein FtsX [Fusibacter bizertensis]